MCKKKKIRKHKILKHPIVAMILLLMWGLLFYQTIGEVFSIFFGVDFFGWVSALAAILALFIHKSWFSPEFKGAIGDVRIRDKDVKFVILGFMAILFIFDLGSFVGHEVALTMANLGLAIMAGIGEEMNIRVLPISVMMRDWMDEKHIPFITYSTSAAFGLIHLVNLLSGAPIDGTIVQIVAAFGIGVIFAAIYLRTGNILYCIFIHTVTDILCVMVVGTTEEGIIQSVSTYDMVTSIIIGILGTVLGTYLIRKSVRSKIVEVWKERWNQETEAL